MSKRLISAGRARELLPAFFARVSGLSFLLLSFFLDPAAFVSGVLSSNVRRRAGQAQPFGRNAWKRAIFQRAGQVTVEYLMMLAIVAGMALIMVALFHKRLLGGMFTMLGLVIGAGRPTR